VGLIIEALAESSSCLVIFGSRQGRLNSKVERLREGLRLSLGEGRRHIPVGRQLFGALGLQCHD